MDLGLGNTLLPGDPRLIDHIVGEVKSQGIFDQFRKDALADVDTKPAYQNLRTRVEASVNSFLTKQTWKADLNKNQLRETLRKQISDAAYLDAGVERIVDQVVNPKIYSVFMPEIEDVVYKYLGLEKPKREKNGSGGLKDLLPIDLDPVSPESDKNSLKDVSLDSVDAGLVMPDEKYKEVEVKVNEVIDDNVSYSDVNNDNINNGHVEEAEKLDEIDKTVQENTSQPSQQLEQSSLNESAKSDEKTEEEEEDSPVFEPIDIMNLNESNISNDSHLSGISELTSHRSRSPDFANEFSRDNFDFSNQDSQFSKVSSDSRLSIVTDFGSSNQASTPISDATKDESNREKIIAKDNFKAIRDESDKNKEAKVSIDNNKVKENLTTDLKESNSNTKGLKIHLSSKESSRDGTDSAMKDKIEQKEKEKNRESSKSKSSKERSDSRDSRSHRDRDKDYKKKSSFSDSKNDNSERSKTRDKSESGRDITEKTRESRDSISSKSKDEKMRESTGSKEPKDLKDIYKEKIRELREKKELTEKEKLNKESKESSKTSKDSNYKKDSSRDKKEHRSSSTSSKNHSSKYESKSKSSSRDDKNTSRSSSKDKSRRDDRRRDSKESKNKSQTESTEKSESRRSSKGEKDEKLESKSSQKSSSKKESRSDSHNKSSEKSDNKRETDSKDKKRRDDKKSKLKDDHPSMRKNSNDRRSSDRDGSNGSNGKGSTEKSNSSPSMSSTTPATSTLNKESSNTSSNSSSETSDGVEEPLTEECPISNNDIIAINPTVLNSSDKNYDDNNLNNKKVDCGQNEISLPLKKRPLNSDDDAAVASSSSSNNEVIIKKPKFARNFQEAKKLMKIRKKLEKQKFLAHYDLEKKIQSHDESDETSSSSLMKKDDVEMVPDNERVQIIEVRVDSDDEPYPDDNTKYAMTPEQQTKIILDGDQSLESEIIATKSKLSEMELSIRESLNEMMSDHNLREASRSDRNIEKSQRNTSTTSKAGKKEKKMVDNIATTSRKFEKKLTTPRNNMRHNIEGEFVSSDSEDDCLYFVADNDRLIRFTKFLEALDVDDYSNKNDSNAMMRDELKSIEMKTMAPPQSKRKYSTSPLYDIILNNSNNNNEGHKITSASTTTTTAAASTMTTTAATTATIYDDESPPKRKKLGRPKKQRQSLNLSSSQNVTNGDHFVMPLSPDSDVSASSEKMPTQLARDDKSRPRNNQRYTSDDLYKPRPLFVSSSRRNRRSNQS